MAQPSPAAALSFARALRCLLLLCLLVAGCGPAEDAPPRSRAAHTPAAAVQRLIDDLRRDDLGAYAVHALPPSLYAQADLAWRSGRSRWPLSELPLHDQLPALIARLSAPGAEAVLRQGYRSQFAGAGDDLRSAAATLALFSTRYLEHESEAPREEREHRLQLIRVLADWGRQGLLADPRRVEPLLPRWVAAARASRLGGGDTAFSSAGMHRSLVHLRPLLREGKASLAALGLDVDAALDGARIETVTATATQARLRLRYRLGGRAVVAMLDLERRPEGWFLSDSLRHARAAIVSGSPRAGPSPALRHNAGDGPADSPPVSGRAPPR